MPSQRSWYPFSFRVLNKIHGEIKMKKFNTKIASAIIFFLIVHCTLNIDNCKAKSGWFWQTSGTNNYLNSIDFADNNTGWVVGYIGTILKTTNSGTNWISQVSGTSSDLYSVQFTDNSTGWTVGSSGTILITSNGGSNWISQFSGSSNELNSVYFADIYTGYAVGDHGTILKTTNGGNNWITQSGGTNNTFKSVYFTSNLIGWTVGYDEFLSGGVILKTTNGGTYWSSLISGTFNHLLSVHFKDNNIGWTVGANGTILKTTNGGVSVGVQNVSTEMPSGYSLNQNYPNPFNPETVISYELPVSETVILKVFDILGKEIKTLVNEKQNSGVHQVSFNASGLPSGVYFYQLKTQGFTDTKRMVLIK